MNESLLNALMELIALFARVNNTHFLDNAHSFIKTYLEQTASGSSQKLLGKYYEYLENFNDFSNHTKFNKNSLNASISEIVSKINTEMTEEERLILFLSFLELIKLDKKIAPEELSFVEILSFHLNIARSDYKNSLLFILCESNNYGDEPNAGLLIVSNTEINNLDDLEGSWIEQNRPHDKDQKLILVKPGFTNDLLVLRLHGSDYLAGKYFGSTPLILNHRTIFPDRFFLMSPYDEIKASNGLIINYQELMTGFKIRNPHSALKFVGENISIKNNDQPGISSFNFCEEPGNLVIVLSNSSYESKRISLLLTGQLPLSTGKICLNGYDISKEKYRVHKMIGYVPKEKVYDENISIYDNFYFSARLSFPGYNTKRVKQLVEETIHALKLQDYCTLPIKKLANTTSIPFEYLKILINTGMEVIRDPFVLVMDLPFEKLNSSSAEEFCNILKSITYKGKLIFLISTNPGACVFKKTDRMWIFDNGGYLIYRGFVTNALNYFKKAGNYNISPEEVCPTCGNTNIDQLHQIIHSKVLDKYGRPTHDRKYSPEDWYKIYKEKIEKREGVAESKKIIPSYSSSIPNVNVQFFAYLKKCFLSLKLNSLKFLFTLSGGLLLSFIISWLLRYDWTNNFTFSKHEYLPLLFFLNTVICFTSGIILGLQLTADDKLHIAFDYYKNYSFFSYLNVKYLVVILSSAVYSLLFTLITDSISGINGLYYLNWLIYFGTIFIGGSIGLLIGYLKLKLRVALLLTMTLLALNVLFSGYILPYTSFPKQISSKKYIPAFTEIFPLRWAYEALIVQQIKDNNYQKKIFKAEQTISDLTFKTNVLMPKLQEVLFNIQNQKLSLSNLSLFYKELTDINKKYPDIFQFEFLEEINKKQVSWQILSELEDYTRYVQFQLYEKLKEHIDLRKELKQKIIDSVGAENFDSFVGQHHNTNLIAFVSAKKAGVNYIENNGEIIQTDDPIFRLPDNNYGRAHFFAPQKLMNGYYYDTTYFNLFVLGLEIFILYILTLIFRNRSINS